MRSLRHLTLSVAFLSILVSAFAAASEADEKVAVETVVRSLEHAIEQYDFEKANSFMAPDAQWIENSYPGTALFDGKSAGSKHWEANKAANLHISYKIRNVETRIRGDVAWLTLAIDTTTKADNPAALALNDNLPEWQGTFIESYVLTKDGESWKVVLAHTSFLSNDKK